MLIELIHINRIYHLLNLLFILSLENETYNIHIMAISEELEKISTCCGQIADNVIELRRANIQLQSDVELLKQTVLECQINLAKITPGNPSVGTFISLSLLFEFLL